VSNIDEGGEDGEDDEAASVDGRGGADAEDARARDGKDICNRAEAEADPGSDVRQGNRTRRVSGHFSDKE
jgi:hypothetical protein